MRIISMIATFGGLNGTTLRLEPGLNVICAPNEWGKSTWCAFLTAMLYGVDTNQRTTKGTLADKEKYAPWSGQPMEGMLRIEHEGRDITIQRRTRGRVPLGDFQAYETRTGLEIPGLNGENCGQQLLGVEKSVFLRTGFIRFSDLTVVPDEALWQRLHALVTTGDESGSAGTLRGKLKELKNRVRSSRGGRIPETEQRIEELEAALSEREMLENRQQQLQSQYESARQELLALQRHQVACDYRDAEQLREQTRQAMETAEEARDAMEAMEVRCRNIPETEELQQKLTEAQDLIVRLQEVPEETPPSVMKAVSMYILGAVSLVAAVFCLLQSEKIWALAAAAIGVVSLVAAGVLTDNRRKIALEQRLAQKKREKLIRELVDATVTLRSQLKLRENLEEACRTADQARLRLQTLVAASKQVCSGDGADTLELTPEETRTRMEQVTERLRLTQLRLGQCQGRMEALAESEQLNRELEGCRKRLAELEHYERALDRAQNALEEASRELQRRFSPRITALAQEYLSRLTQGKYSRVVIGEDLSILAASESETTLRSGQWRSDGTSDLMYLALRLAVWVTLNPDGPLVLDDALVRLDDRRLASVMDLLSELGGERQIVLFSCQEREKNYVS